jgi:alpha-1,6-mannosyltransferase
LETATAARLRPTAVAGVTRRRAAHVALGSLALVYIALAVPVAAPHSTVVLAAAERSPDWLLGPWRSLGADGADGSLTGPLFYVGLWVSLLAYAIVLACSRAIGARLAIGSIVALHVLFALAPPLLSQDVFSYISYARLDVVHGLGPYTHSPNDVPGDAVYVFAGSKDASSVYGPLFTIATLPLAKLSVPVAFWTLKAVAALASLGVVGLAWACARRLGGDPIFAALAVGLNPLVLVHVVGGAHNDALLVLLMLGAVVLALAPSREPTAGAVETVATAVKVSSGLMLPFLVAGTRRRLALIAGALAGAVATLVVSLAVFGADAFDALGLIGENQERTSSWSFPQRVADGLALVSGGSADAIVDYTRAAFALAFVFLLVVLVRRSLRAGPGSVRWVADAGWATLALLVASAWLVPWYSIWLVPLAALSGSRALMATTLALCAYMLVIAVPL